MRKLLALAATMTAVTMPSTTQPPAAQPPTTESTPITQETPTLRSTSAQRDAVSITVYNQNFGADGLTVRCLAGCDVRTVVERSSCDPCFDAVDRAAEGVGYEVRVDLLDDLRGVTEQACYDGEAHAVLREPRCEGMAS